MVGESNGAEESEGLCHKRLRPQIRSPRDDCIGITSIIAVILLPALKGSARKTLALFIVTGLLIVGSVSIIPFARADELPLEMVPAPRVDESHTYNQWGAIDGVETHDLYINEEWSIAVTHGDVMTLIRVWNTSSPLQNNISGVNYQNTIHYRINGTLYLAGFEIGGARFLIGNQTISSPLSTCGGFELEYSPVRYNGTLPTFDCNITFEDIRVYESDHQESTFNLTLIHHIKANWNQTDDKIEALFNFSNTRFYQSDGTEFGEGAPFTAELEYMMSLGVPGVGEPILPTSHTNTTMKYDIMYNGAPLTISRLEMKDSFTIYNVTGSCASMGYSSMEIQGWGADVVHGFPNLTYMDTQSMKSDPEITVFHDLVTESGNQEQGTQWGLVVTAIMIIAVGAVSAVFFIRSRKKNRGKDDETLKKA